MGFAIQNESQAEGVPLSNENRRHSNIVLTMVFATGNLPQPAAGEFPRNLRSTVCSISIVAAQVFNFHNIKLSLQMSCFAGSRMIFSVGITGGCSGQHLSHDDYMGLSHAECEERDVFVSEPAG